MAYIVNDDLVQEYVSCLCAGTPIVHHWASTLEVSKNNELIYHRRGGYRRTPWGPVVLCEWQEKRKLFVLNGDGFTDNSATRYQTNLRVLIQGMIQAEQGDVANRGLPHVVRRMIQNGQNANGRRYVLIPFLALNASQIDKQSIAPIFVQEDEFESVWHPMPEPPDIPGTREVPDELPDGWTEISTDNPNDRNIRAFEVRHQGQRFRILAQRRNRYRNRKTGQVTDYLSYGTNQDDWVYGPVWLFLGRWTVWGVMEGETPNGWQQLTQYRDFPRQGNHRVVGDVEPMTVALHTVGFTERIHHLGASVFSASNGESRRAKFISAFDEQETTQRMYYLARLPNEAKPTTYREAIHALAPPLVHKAWEKGTLVRRQGDIFAIETNLTDEQVYADAITRVRRAVALFNMNVQAVATAISGGQPLLEPAKGEVRERADCLCGCGHKRWIGCGPKARRALSIYRTGHTATEVVVTPRGTFVRGTMHHDPHIEEPGRRPEHMTVPLGDRNKWFLACRNTVPRQKRRTNNTEGS